MCELPLTDHFEMLPNRFERHFLGRIDINYGAALLEFYKFGTTQSLVHKLKYEGKANIGWFLGEMAGQRMNNYNWSRHIDYIVPVPLHWRKEKMRGYNQALKFAEGIRNKTNIAILYNGLIKTKDNETQTNKTRVRRMQNVADSYECTTRKNLDGRHILLVDDVITTGATLEACALALQAKYRKIKLSMLTIGIANEW